MNDKQQLAAMGEHLAEQQQPICLQKRVEQLEALLREAVDAGDADYYFGSDLLSRIESALDGPHPPTNPPRVRKSGGSFQHTGSVVSSFKTLAGEPRIVLEFDAPVGGMLHIYRPDQVEPL